MERHHHRNGLADLELVARYNRTNEQAYVSSQHQPYSQQQTRPYAHHKSCSSLSSDSSAPGLVEDKDSEPCSEDDLDYHAAGTELWDTFWQAQKAQSQPRVHVQDENAPYYGDYTPRRKRPAQRQYQERGYYEESSYEDYYYSTSPARRDEHQWPLSDEPVQARQVRSPLRAVASYSLFPRPVNVPPRTTSLSSFGAGLHHRDLSQSQSRSRPPPLPLYQTTLDPTFPQPNPITPPLLTSQSDPIPMRSPPRSTSSTRTALPLPPSTSLPFHAPPSFLHHDPTATPHPNIEPQPEPISVFEDSDTEEHTGLAARIVRGLHKRSASETRRSARGGDVAAAQLRRARAGTQSQDVDAEERGRRPGSSEGVFGKMLGRRSRQ